MTIEELNLEGNSLYLFFFFLTEIVHDCQDYALRYSGIRRLSLLQLTCVVVRLIELNEAFTAVRFI